MVLFTMGIGDEIMASAQARHVHDTIGGKIDFGEYHPQVWKGNPIICRQGGGTFVRNRTGDRPYQLLQTPERVVFNPNYHALPGEIYLNKRHLKDAKNFLGKTRNYIVVEPHVKAKFSKGNKDWGWSNWVKLTNKLDNVVQLLSDKTKKKLPNAKCIYTENVMVAFAILHKAKLAILTDGALHHAAAATFFNGEDAKHPLEEICRGVPAVVIWTGFSHPQCLGYQSHINIRADDSPACGSKYPCQHCKDMAKRVSVETVYDSVSTLLD